MICIRFLLILLVAGGFLTFHPSLSAQAKKTAPSVIKAFNDGLKEFKAGNFKQALDQFSANLKNYPDHNPSMVYYARSLYRLDRIPDSFQVFSRLDPNTLDIETSYEYGLTFFWSGQFQGALFGFRRIPPSHPLSDLANYYGAISAMKLRYYADAEAMMEKAIVLPAKFVKSKRLYQKHIKELKYMQEKESLALERKKEKDRIKQSSATVSDAKNKKPAEKEKPVSTVTPTPPQQEPLSPEGHKGLLPFEREVLARIDFREQKQDFHGYGDKRSHLRLTSLEAKVGKLFAIPPGQNDGRTSALVLSLELSGFEQLLKGDGERRNVQFEDERDIHRVLTTDPTRELSKWGEVAIHPWLEIALPQNFWLGAGAKAAYKYPDFERENRTSSFSGFLQLGILDKSLITFVKYEYLELKDKLGDAITGQHKEEGDFTYLALEPFVLRVNLRNISFKYFDETLDGPSSDTRLLGDLAVTFPLGFSLGLIGAVAYQSQYLLHNLPTYGEVNANGTLYTAKPYLLFAPVTWFSLEVYEQLQKSSWNVDPSAAQNTYERNQVDYFEEFKAAASLNLLF